MTDFKDFNSQMQKITEIKTISYNHKGNFI